MSSVVQIPPPNANPQTISPPGGQFQISVTQACSVNFGTPTPPNVFPEFANKPFQWGVGTLGPYDIPPTANDQISYTYTLDARAGMEAPMIGHVIIVGSGRLPKTTSRKKTAPAKKKPAAKKSSARTTAKKKPAKKAAKKSATKSGKKPAKKSAKKTAKKKSAKKARR